MRIGVSAAQYGRLATPAAVRAAAVAAEEVGYASLWVSDRLTEPPSRGQLDPLGVLAAVAGATRRVRLGTSVLVAPRYPPTLLVRALTTLEVLSEGRLLIGLGFGAAAGGPDRAAHLDRVLDAIDQCWPEGRPPLLLAASGPAGLDRVARRADGWNPAGLPTATLRASWEHVLERAAIHGREPERLQLVVRADIVLTREPIVGARESYHGDFAQVAADLEATRAAGAHEVVLGLAGDPSLDEALDTYARLAEAIS